MSANPTPTTEYGGECAFAVSLGKRGVAGKDGWHAVRDGKRYVFSNPVAKLLWLILPGRRQVSDRQWSSRHGSPGPSDG